MVFVMVEGSTPKPAARSFVFTGLFFPFMNLIYSTFFGESSSPVSPLMDTMFTGKPKNVCYHSKNIRGSDLLALLKPSFSDHLLILCCGWESDPLSHVEERFRV